MPLNTREQAFGQASDVVVAANPSGTVPLIELLLSLRRTLTTRKRHTHKARETHHRRPIWYRIFVWTFWTLWPPWMLSWPHLLRRFLVRLRLQDSRTLCGRAWDNRCSQHSRNIRDNSSACFSSSASSTSSSSPPSTLPTAILPRSMNKITN